MTWLLCLCPADEVADVVHPHPLPWRLVPLFGYVLHSPGKVTRAETSIERLPLLFKRWVLLWHHLCYLGISTYNQKMEKLTESGHQRHYLLECIY